MRKSFARRVLVIAAVVAVAFLLLACGADVPQNTLNPTGEVARKQRDLLVLVLWPAIAIFVVVEALVVLAIIWFRRRRGPLPRQTHGNTRLELAWTIAPTLLLLGIAVPTVQTIFDLDSPPDEENALRINVTGHQWWWEFEYPDFGFVTANEAHIPVGRTIIFSITSNDVIHSFWTPKLAGKVDAVPGRNNKLWLTADEPGNYFGQCAEFCGISHANMRFRVIAENDQDFQAWVRSQQQAAGQPPAGNAAEGARFFNTIVQGQQNQCSACHAIAGVPLAQGQIGPNLTHFASRGTFAGSLFENNTENLRAWLHDPKGVKPGAKMPVCGEDVDRPAVDCQIRLSEQDIENLIAYLQSLR